MKVKKKAMQFDELPAEVTDWLAQHAFFSSLSGADNHKAAGLAGAIITPQLPGGYSPAYHEQARQPAFIKGTQASAAPMRMTTNTHFHHGLCAQHGGIICVYDISCLLCSGRASIHTVPQIVLQIRSESIPAWNVVRVLCAHYQMKTRRVRAGHTNSFAQQVSVRARGGQQTNEQVMDDHHIDAREVSRTMFHSLFHTRLADGPPCCLFECTALYPVTASSLALNAACVQYRH